MLFGNPWAQTLSGKRGELTKLLDGRVFTVLLLDEFEKAHAKCHDRFLQLFDEGQFINAAGETVPCNNPSSSALRTWAPRCTARARSASPRGAVMKS